MSGAAGVVAVGIMAKAPEPGAVKTRLCPPLSPREAAALAACFLLDRVEQLQALEGIEPVVAFTPPDREAVLRALVADGIRLLPQVGPDLGARLERLLGDLLAAGCIGALALDADSPTLPTAYLAEAVGLVRAGDADVVLGPCDDGGYYLVGLRRPAPVLFAAMPWSTPALLAETVTRAARAGLRVRLLPGWFDVDRPEDLARLRPSAGVPGAHRPWRTLAYLATLGW